MVAVAAAGVAADAVPAVAAAPPSKAPAITTGAMIFLNTVELLLVGCSDHGAIPTLGFCAECVRVL